MRAAMAIMALVVLAGCKPDNGPTYSERYRIWLDCVGADDDAAWVRIACTHAIYGR